jgi:uncharacterized protein (DUF433 family)
MRGLLWAVGSVRPVEEIARRVVACQRPVCYSPSMLDWSSCETVERDPARLGGAWVFKGTRVPVTALFENLEDGASLDQFLEWFPGVTRTHVEAVLEHTLRSLSEA